MQDQPTRTVEKLGADERVALAEQLREQEEILDNVDGLKSDLIQDKDTLRRQVNRTKKILARDESMVPKTPAERMKIEAEIKRIKDTVVKDMPTVTEMNAPLGSPESQRAVRRNMRFHQLHNGSLIRLKHLLRCIDPEDPEIDNLERIRPK